jgi:hypothetical protein
MNLLAELQSVASQVEDKGDFLISDLLGRAHAALEGLEAEQLTDKQLVNATLRQSERLLEEHKLALARLAALEQQKPVATVRVTHRGYAMELSTHTAYTLQEGTHSLFAAAGAYPVEPAKDHEIAALVNRLTAIAKEFHGTQQLRERISHEVLPFVKGAQPSQAREFSTEGLFPFTLDLDDSQPSQAPDPVYCGLGCDCLTQCGDAYENAGLEKPPAPPDGSVPAKELQDLRDAAKECFGDLVKVVVVPGEPMAQPSEPGLQQFQKITVIVRQRPEVNGSPIKPKAKGLEGLTLNLIVLWRIEDDHGLYPGEWALGLGDDESEAALRQADVSWIASGDVEVQS